MALQVGTLYGVLELDAKPFEKTLKQATTKGQTDLLDGLNKLGRQAAFGFGLGFAGFKLESAFKSTVDEARQAEKATALTQAVLRSTGGAAGVSAKQVDDLANSLSKVAGVDDEVISNGERVLLTFLKIRNVGPDKIFDDATKAAVDMSAALGTDLQSSIIAIGKALNEPSTGALALSRNGSLARSDLKKLQEMMKDGTPLIEQQRFILQKLGEQYSGAAAAGATAGDKLHVSIKNLEEAVGTALLPEIDALDRGLGTVADGFTALPGAAQTTIVTVGSVATVAIAGSIALKKLTEALEGTRIAAAATGAEDTLLRLFPVLGTTAAAAGTVGIGAAVAVIGGSLIHAEHDATQRTQELTAAMVDAGDASDTAAAKFLRARLSVDSIAKGLQTGGVSIEQAVQAIIKGGSTFKDMETRLFNNPLTHNQALTLQALRDSYVKASDAAEHHAKKQKQDNDKMDDGSKAAKELADRMDKLAAAYEKRATAAFDAHIGQLVDTMQAAQGVTSAESSLSDAIKGTGDEASSSASKMKTYSDAVAQVFDSVLAADRAHTAASQSIRKLTDTNKEFTGDAVARLNGLIRIDGKQVATQDDLHSALLDVIEAREREVDSMANSGEIANTAQARHQALVDSLLDLRNQYPGLAGDIDRYIDAARKIPELPLEAAIDKVAHKQDDMADATLGVISALEQQAKADDDPINGLESMNTQLDALIKKYKDFPATKDAFSKALAESILTEAQILAGQMSLPTDLIAGILGLPAADRTGAFAGLFGLSYNPPGRASGGPVAANMPYLTGEHGPEWFVPNTSGTIIPNGGASGLHIGNLEYHAGRDDRSGPGGLADELRVVSLTLSA
jgi:hypothetical protein